jgi:hypothetical protein
LRDAGLFYGFLLIKLYTYSTVRSQDHRGSVTGHTRPILYRYSKQHETSDHIMLGIA